MPYCGAPPDPGTLLTRFNFDPVLIAGLLVIAGCHVLRSKREGQSVLTLAIGWLIAAAALVSPLCALSVSLFSARVAQHMILTLVAAPLIASALPRWQTLKTPAALWGGTIAFFVLLWLWHMPAPYAATFASVPLYWTMHLTLFGSAVLLWGALLRGQGAQVLLAGTVTSIQMGLLGAVICLAGRPMYAPHLLTTEAWGLTPLADQQLGGVVMWVPGCLLFLWAALHSLAAIWARLEGTAHVQARS